MRSTVVKVGGRLNIGGSGLNERSLKYSKSLLCSLSGSESVNPMKEIVDGVKFNVIAREWRLKWSSENDKKSLVEVNQLMNKFTPKLKTIDGFKSLQRIVCGQCNDFKLITAVNSNTFGKWAQTEFEPESEFLSSVKSIPGVSSVETQTYTLMDI